MKSQFSFERNESGERCLVYREDLTTKTNDGGLKSMRKERKVVWVYPSADPMYCPVRIIDKYLSLLPPVGTSTKKPNFYLRSLEKISPAQWYGEQVVGLNTLKKVVKEMMKGTEGFFTNHSLRRTSTTRLFRGGVDRKLVKEFTGHSSDAVDSYQITSDEQRKHMSNIIHGSQNKDKSKKIEESNPQVAISVLSTGSNKKQLGCECACKSMNMSETDKIGKMVNTILQHKKGLKAKIKLEIEFME